MRGWGVRCVAVLFLCFAVPGLPGAEAADKVQFTMDWIIGGQHALFISGLGQGFYQRAGIEPTIDRGFGGADTLKKIGGGAADFGFADLGAAVVARSQGAPTKAFAVIFDKGQYVFLVDKASGIRTPKDLEGRTIANSPGSPTHVLFPALAAANQIDESKVNWLIVQPPMIFQSFLAGKADVAASFLVTVPPLQASARAQGKELVSIVWSDWGVDVYSNGILTTDAKIAQKPDLVRRFARAAIESTAWTMENPDAAISTLIKHHPTVNAQIGREALKIAIESALTPIAREKGLGYMSEEKMTRTRDLLTKYMKLPVTVPVKDLYTLEFLPGIKVSGK